MINEGDLVRLITDDQIISRIQFSVFKHLQSSLFFKRLLEDVGDSHGLVVKINGNSAVVMFEGKKKVIHVSMLKTVSCGSCGCDPCDCDWGH